MKFTEEHEWLRSEGDIVVVGITEHASTQLGDVVFVELPEEGATVSKDDEKFIAQFFDKQLVKAMKESSGKTEIVIG